MKQKLIALCSIFMIMVCLSAKAAENKYPFETPEQEKRFQVLSSEIRCMVCENQSISDSHAPLAEDLRSEIYQQILSGKTDVEIKDFLLERYGDTILYEPPIRNNTFLLWGAPIILLLIGALVWIRQIKSGNQKNRI